MTISIHAPREGGDFSQGLDVDIKIHFNPRPPREGGDATILRNEYEDGLISIHAPREGGDYLKQKYGISKVQFQSTSPARGATV